MSIEFAISSFNWKTIASLVVIGLVIGGLIWSGLFFANFKSQQVLTIGTVGLGLVIFCLIFWPISSVKIKLDAAALVVGSGLYQVTVPMGQVDRSAVRRWTEEDVGYKPRWRVNGIGMPGFSLGWFTSKQSKIFAAISDRENVVVIPTSAGYTILASPSNPQEFVDKIRAL